MAQVEKDSLIFKIGIRNRPFWFFLMIFGILLDVFVFKFNFDLLTLIIAGFWIFIIRKNEAPTSLRSGDLLRALRQERNPAEAGNSSHSSVSLRSRFSAKADKLDGKISLFGGLILLVICSLLLMFRLNLPADKTATWAYIFLTVGVFQTLWNYKKEDDEEI